MKNLINIFGKEVIIPSDSKARRVLNVSSQNANITAEEIEKGVTIEKLASINVPVFAYQTQITIHGTLPDLQNNYVQNYKSIIKNQNGSIGVKYNAIDAEKKKLM